MTEVGKPIGKVVDHLKWDAEGTKLLGYIPKNVIDAVKEKHEDCMVAEVRDGHYCLELFAIKLDLKEEGVKQNGSNGSS